MRRRREYLTSATDSWDWGLTCSNSGTDSVNGAGSRRRLLGLDAGCRVVDFDLPSLHHRAVQLLPRPIRIRTTGEGNEAESFRSSFIEDDLNIKDRTKLLLLSFTMQKEGSRQEIGRGEEKQEAKSYMREAFRRGIGMEPGGEEG